MSEPFIVISSEVFVGRRQNRLASGLPGDRYVGTKLHRLMSNFTPASAEGNSRDNRRNEDQPLHTLHSLSPDAVIGTSRILGYWRSGF